MPKPPKPKLPGLIKGMGVTFNEMTQTIWPGEGAKRFMDVAGDGECITYAIADEGEH